MRESRVEQHLTRRVREAGGDTFKLAPTHVGMPDRLVMLPGGLIFLVELKAPGGRLRPAQIEWHRRAEGRGTSVHVLSSIEAVDDWVAAHALI